MQQARSPRQCAVQPPRGRVVLALALCPCETRDEPAESPEEEELEAPKAQEHLPEKAEVLHAPEKPPPPVAVSVQAAPQVEVSLELESPLLQKALRPASLPNPSLGNPVHQLVRGGWG